MSTMATWEGPALSVTGLAARTNVKAVQRMLGHAPAPVTVDVYADLFDDDLDAVADRLDRSVRGLRRILCGRRAPAGDRWWS